MEMKQLVEQLQKEWHDMKQVLDRAHEEKRKYGQELAETKQMVERFQDRLDQIETLIQRTNMKSMDSGAEDGDAIEVKAFDKWLRKGEDGLTPEELKALSTDSDPDGGYRVPVQRSNRIIQKLTEISPIRRLATVETITLGDTLEIPREDGEFDAAWVGERESRPNTGTAKFGVEKITAHEMYAAPLASQKMLEDAGFDVENWINRKITEKFAKLEGQAFVNGDGVGKPLGLLAAPGVTELPSGSANGITADALIDMFYELPAEYAQNGTWLMRRSTIREIRKLKDSQGNYLWQPGIAGVAPATILDRPYVEVPDMPEIAANAYAVIFGDIRRAYVVVNRRDIRMLRDPYSKKPWVEFYTTYRVGGKVVQPDAIVKMRIGA